MSPYNFKLLDIELQAEVTYAGVLLCQRQHYPYKINLYSVGNFFVEVWYDPSEDEIKSFRPFKSVELLESYLDKIKLVL
jgi:hypothetical protein